MDRSKETWAADNMSEAECPATVKVKAIDIKPYRYALWCSIEGGKPFANDIGPRRWSEDGKHIWFMLESHNFFKAKPHEEVEVIPYTSPYATAESLAASDARDAERMANRPMVACEACGAMHRVTDAKEGE